MSRSKWLIVAALALGDVIVLGVMAAVVVSSVTRLSSTPILGLTTTPVSAPTETPPPTWTAAPSPMPHATRTPRPSNTPTGTATPWPTFAPTPTPTPAPAPLENPIFEGIGENLIPGWQTGAFVNWAPADRFDPHTSYSVPRFHQADDPRQWINGSTLQIDTEPWVKLRAWVFQTVDLAWGSQVQFQVRAVGLVKELAGGYILKAGVDPDGGEGCDAARWGPEEIANQEDGVVVLVSPEVVVGQAGRVTVCMFAETQFAQAYHAAFFDDAVLTVLSPASQ